MLNNIDFHNLEREVLAQYGPSPTARLLMSIISKIHVLFITLAEFNRDISRFNTSNNMYTTEISNADLEGRQAELKEVLRQDIRGLLQLVLRHERRN